MVRASHKDPLETEETVGLDAVRDNSRQLYELVAGYFASIKTARDEEFANSKPPLRYYDLAARVGADLSPYPLPARRVFVAHRRSAGTSAALRKLEELYADMRMDAWFRQWAPMASVQRSMLGAVTPASGRIGMRVEAYFPWQFVVEFDDACEEDIRRARRVTLLVPVEHEPMTRDGRVVYGRRVYTQSEAWVEDLGGVEIGPVFETRRHDFGRIPLSAIRLAPPIRPGLWMPNVDTSVLSMVEKLCLNDGDVEMTDRHAIGQTWATGADAPSLAAEMAQTPDGVNIAMGEVKFERLEVDPPTTKRMTNIERSIAVALALRNANVSPFVHSNALTGAAKEWDRVDQQLARAQTEALWAQFETDLAQDVAAVWNRSPGMRSPALDERVSVSVDYAHPKPRENSLQAAQARAIDYAHGLSTPIETIAEAENVPLGVSPEEMGATALDRWRWRRKFNESIQVDGDTPGIDRTGEAVRRDGPGRPSNLERAADGEVGA